MRSFFPPFFWVVLGRRAGRSLTSFVLSEPPPVVDQILCPMKRSCFSYLKAHDKLLPGLPSCFFLKMENKHLRGFEMFPYFRSSFCDTTTEQNDTNAHREIIARHLIGVFCRVRVRGRREY